MEKTRVASLDTTGPQVSIPAGAGAFRRFMAFVGPGMMVAVGYMDPGNWATDIAGGSQFGYALLSVILVSNLFAMLLQHLCVRLGVATGLDLAQACRAYFSRPVSLTLWVLAELAIAATDLAEILGSALALQLLFGLPLPVGVLLTVLDVFLLLLLQHRGLRLLEVFVAGLVAVIMLCFGYQLLAARPDVQAVLAGLVPRSELITNPEMLYLGIGILGATVMPHNLYLHSHLVQTRTYAPTPAGHREAIRFGTLDSTLSLTLAFFVNAAILIVAAAAFHANGHFEVADITDAHHLLDPLLGVKLAGAAFAIALLAAGQNATITGTLSGQIVMEGFLKLKLKPWVRRLITRLIAVIPALIATFYYGDRGTASLLVFSQVVLSLQLSFAVVPLVWFTGRPDLMGPFVSPRWLRAAAWGIAVVIAGLNLYLLKTML